MNPCILSYTCLSLEWKASSFLLLSLKGGLVFGLIFFFLLRCLMFKNEVRSVKDVWVDLQRQMKAKTPAGNPPSPFQMDQKPWGSRRLWEERKRYALLASLGGFLSPVHRVHHQLLICSVSQWFPCHPLPMSSSGPPEAVFSSWSYKCICCHMLLFAVRLKQKGSAHRKSHYQWHI